MPQRLRALLFDAGNTLISLDYDRLAAGVSEAVGREISAATLRARAAEAAAALGYIESESAHLPSIRT